MSGVCVRVAHNTEIAWGWCLTMTPAKAIASLSDSDATYAKKKKPQPACLSIIYASLMGIQPFKSYELRTRAWAQSILYDICVFLFYFVAATPPPKRIRGGEIRRKRVRSANAPKQGLLRCSQSATETTTQRVSDDSQHIVAGNAVKPYKHMYVVEWRQVCAKYVITKRPSSISVWQRWITDAVPNRAATPCVEEALPNAVLELISANTKCFHWEIYICCLLPSLSHNNSAWVLWYWGIRLEVSQTSIAARQNWQNSN